MRIIKQNDYLKVKSMSLVADYDYLTLVNLYQPIIGYAAVALYLTLYSEIQNGKVSQIIEHNSLLNKMQINMSNFANAKRFLEATGLIRTYLKKEKEISIYQYNLYAPKTPMNFFENSLLVGLLIKTLGEERADQLKNIYVKDDNVTSNCEEEVTASFIEVFHPNLDDPSFAIANSISKGAIGRKSAHVKSTFLYERFFDSIKLKSQYNENSFTKKEMKEIERISLLYGLNEEEIATNVISVYDIHKKKGLRVDFDQLVKTVIDSSTYYFSSKNKRVNNKTILSSNNDLAQKIELMENTSPSEFLKILQNGVPLSGSDMALLNILSKKYNLPNGTINAIIDYVLTVNDNVLNSNYVEKIAGSVIRENVTSALETMNFLKKTASNKKGRKVTKKENHQVIEKKEETNEVSDANLPSWDELINEIEQGDIKDGED